MARNGHQKRPRLGPLLTDGVDKVGDERVAALYVSFLRGLSSQLLVSPLERDDIDFAGSHLR
jgi:hypothetical protein